MRMSQYSLLDTYGNPWNWVSGLSYTSKYKVPGTCYRGRTLSHINGSPREESHRNHALTLLHRPLLSVSPHAVHVQEEDIRLMKVMFDFYDRDRDGKLTPSQACLLCTWAHEAHFICWFWAQVQHACSCKTWSARKKNSLGKQESMKFGSRYILDLEWDTLVCNEKSCNRPAIDLILGT